MFVNEFPKIVSTVLDGFETRSSIRKGLSIFCCLPTLGLSVKCCYPNISTDDKALLTNFKDKLKTIFYLDIDLLNTSSDQRENIIIWQRDQIFELLDKSIELAQETKSKYLDLFFLMYEKINERFKKEGYNITKHIESLKSPARLAFTF